MKEIIKKSFVANLTITLHTEKCTTKCMQTATNPMCQRFLNNLQENAIMPKGKMILKTINENKNNSHTIFFSIIYNKSRDICNN